MIPNIVHRDIFWEGKLLLDNWNDFYREEIQLTLNIGGDSIIDEVTEIHELGYSYLISEQKEILEIILNAVFEQYSSWQDEYDYDEDEKVTFMPDISNATDLKPLIYPEKVLIMDVEVEKMPYIGVQFRCKWDEEHGLGIMLYKDRVVEVGGADTAFMTWIAEEDKEKM
ncbi:hypothetical protein IMX26_03430 [Clostridium sp. 'deep sea']|uniref:DUF6985 domain-containing protein n=1 Tax=Clostridium sp. 'deep sea' TaxID=2779445 RepID=UPI0018966205|nr:hypothetical protein [Clostridium sp. 'deep sea']QOR35883.1 hypothetical protein IMX26_03430 [Clostridium sp. 'deep sea']